MVHEEELKTLREGKEQAKRQSEDLRLQITELQVQLHLLLYFRWQTDAASDPTNHIDI